MQKEITIYDVAEKLGISASTVSRALSNNPVVKARTKEKILRAANEMGYQHNTIASNLRKQQSKTIGLLLHEVDSNFITSVLAGIEKITFPEGYDLLIVHSGEDETKEIANTQNLFRKRVDGVLASLALGTKSVAHFKAFANAKIPLVFFDRVPDEAIYTKVVINNFQGGYEATQHLIEQGCKRIAHITADLSRNVYRDRFEGYKKALKDCSIKFDKSLIQVCSLNKEDTISAVETLLEAKPDAFFITNDFSAAICINELYKRKIKVPSDIAVMGFNNDILGELIRPTLSTIDYPGMLVGQTAAEELIKRLKLKAAHKNAKPGTTIVPHRLIIRRSSKK